MIVQISIRRVFSMPLGVLLWQEHAELNDQLRDLILDQARVDEGIPLDEVSGWHSRNDLFHIPHSAVATLRERILRSIGAMSSLLGEDAGESEAPWFVFSWANIMRNGHRVDWHHHGRYRWAGVYYVDVGGPSQSEAGGVFEILDPASRQLVVACRDAHGMTNGELRFETIESDERLFSIVPEKGLMMIFPGSLSHRVTAYSGTAPRVSISFNANRATYRE